MTRGIPTIKPPSSGFFLLWFLLIVLCVRADSPSTSSINGAWIQLGARIESGGLRLIESDQTTQPARRDGLLGRWELNQYRLRFKVLPNFGLAAFGWYSLQIELWPESIVEIEVQYALQGGGTSSVKTRTDAIKRWKTYILTLPRAEMCGKFDGADLIVIAPKALIRTVALYEATPPQTRGMASGYYSPSIIPPPGLDVILHPSSRHGSTLGSHLQFLKSQAETTKAWGVRGIVHTITWNDIEPMQGAIEAERLHEIGRTYQQLGLSWWLQLDLREIQDAPPWYRDRLTAAQDLTTLQSAPWPSRWDPAWLNAWNHFSRTIATQAQTITSIGGIVVDMRLPEIEHQQMTPPMNGNSEPYLWAGDIHARRSWANSEYTFNLLPFQKLQSEKEKHLIQSWYERPRLEPLELALDTLHRLLPSIRLFLLLDEDDPLLFVQRDSLLTLAKRYQSGILLSIHTPNVLASPSWSIVAYEALDRRISLGIAIPQNQAITLSPSLALAALVEKRGSVLIMGEDDLEAPGAMERWNEANTLLQDQSTNLPIAVILPKLETLERKSSWLGTLEAMRDCFPFDTTDTASQSLLEKGYLIIIDLQERDIEAEPASVRDQIWNQWIEQGGTAIIYHPSNESDEVNTPSDTAGQIITIGKGSQIILSSKQISMTQLPNVLARLISDHLPENGSTSHASIVSEQDGVFTIHLSQQVVEVKTADARMAAED